MDEHTMNAIADGIFKNLVPMLKDLGYEEDDALGPAEDDVVSRWFVARRPSLTMISVTEILRFSVRYSAQAILTTRTLLLGEERTTWENSVDMEFLKTFLFPFSWFGNMVQKLLKEKEI